MIDKILQYPEYTYIIDEHGARIPMRYDAAIDAYTSPVMRSESNGANFAQERAVSAVDMASAPSETVTHLGFDTVLSDELNQLAVLCAIMLDNGASVYELQQRIMGF